jgi:hypothetical protein
MGARLGRDWSSILAQAKGIVDEYDTGVTLRQLFYRLVVLGVLRNLQTDYRQLSAYTAEARRGRTFPRLLDRTRRIHRYQTFPSPSAARTWLADIYRMDRTEGQPVSLYLGVEKHGVVAQLQSWFGDLGVPVLSVGGFSSQTYVDEIADDVAEDRAQGRPSVLLYAGDFDPSGEDILRDLLARAACFDELHRVALTAEQVAQYGLPKQMGKESDSRAQGFVARHGELVQVELDALAPELLRQLFADAIAAYWSDAAYRTVLRREARERRTLAD